MLESIPLKSKLLVGGLGVYIYELHPRTSTPCVSARPRTGRDGQITIIMIITITNTMITMIIIMIAIVIMIMIMMIMIIMMMIQLLIRSNSNSNHTSNDTNTITSSLYMIYLRRISMSVPVSM